MPSISQSSTVLQWGHGDEAVEEVQCTTARVDDRRRFNGATAMKPWKSPRRHRSTLARSLALQWGHGDEAVEEATVTVCKAMPGPASMGPRR